MTGLEFIKMYQVGCSSTDWLTKHEDVIANLMEKYATKKSADLLKALQNLNEAVYDISMPSGLMHEVDEAIKTTLK